MPQSTDIERVSQPQSVASVADSDTGSALIQVISRAAADPSIDVDKMERLFALAERGEAIQREIRFNEALARLQPQLPRIVKRGKVDFNNNHYSFAKYEDVMEVIQPLLAAEGFSLSFDEEWTTTMRTYVCTLSHVKGHSRQSRMALPPDEGAGRNKLQALGSADSYMRRYLVFRLLNIVTVGEDNDGNSLSFIDERKVNTIMDMFLAASMSPESQTKFLGVIGAKSVSEIHLRDYEKAMTLLRQKVRQVQAGR